MIKAQRSYEHYPRGGSIPPTVELSSNMRPDEFCDTTHTVNTSVLKAVRRIRLFKSLCSVFPNERNGFDFPLNNSNILVRDKDVYSVLDNIIGPFYL